MGAAAAAVCAVTFGSLVRDGAAPSGPSAAVREATTPARGGSDGTTPVVEVADDPVAAAVTLTRRRAEVLAAGDPAALADVSRPGSGAHAADLALLADLRAADVRLEGLTAVVDGAAATTDGGSAAGGPPSGPAAVPQVDVTVRSGLSAHRRVTPDGVVDVPAQPVRDVVLRLALTGDGWRVEDVVAEG